MPPKRPTRAIPIINPNLPSPAWSPPPAPPLPPINEAPPKPRISHGYKYLRPTLENIEPEKIPITFPDIDTFARIDPLHHVLNHLFLPQKCDTTTAQERFAAFCAATTPLEWDLTSKWKFSLEMNADIFKIMHTSQGPDAVVSLAMKLWVQRILGHTLEETHAFASGYNSVRHLHPPGLPALYSDPTITPPVYHLHQSNTHPKFPPYVHYSRGNVYNPRRAPLIHSSMQQPLHYTPSLSSLDTNSPHLSHGLPTVPGSQPPRRTFPLVTRPQSLVPNPSGRTTPPHKRSPKKKKKSPVAEKTNIEVVDERTRDWRDAVPKLIVDKWAKGKECGGKSSTCVETKPINADNTKSNIEDSSKLTTALQHDIVKTLFDGESQIAEQVLSADSATIYNPQSLSWRKLKVSSADPKALETVTLRQETDMVESNISALIAKAHVKGTEKKLAQINMGEVLDTGEHRSSFQSSGLISDRKSSTPHSFIPKNTSWLTNDPRLLNVRKPKAPSAGGIAPAISPVSIQYTHSGRAKIPEEPGFADLGMGTSRKTTSAGSLPPISGPAPACPPLSPNYATAVSGPNRKNIDHSHLRVIINPIKLTESPPTTPIVLAQEPSTIISSLSSSKTWSSVVTGESADLNTNNQQQNRIAANEFPKLGKPLAALPSNQLPGLKQKTSLSAMAKPFEPAGLEHAVSVESYLRTSKLPVAAGIQLPIATPTHSAAPAVINFAQPVPRTEFMRFPFNHLLEIFYNTSQFTKYLNKSYNELLFKENYLRAQYQRISDKFVEEWDCITAQQRRAIIARALSNLSDRVDRVQFREVTGMDNVLRDFGLTKYCTPTFATMPQLQKRPMNPGLSDSYFHGSPTEIEQRNNSNTMREAYLKWRAEYCFDCDPDALSISPDWFYGIISTLLGIPHPLRHRFGPGWHNKGSTSSASSDQEEGTFEWPEFWCPNDCRDCDEAEKTGMRTEWTFNRNNWSHAMDNPPPRNSAPCSPMLERFLNEIELPAEYLGNPTPFEPSSSKPHIPTTPFMYTQLSVLKKVRLMSNRYTDPIFARSDEWKADNPGRTKFIELMNIDIALFHCELIEEVLQIFGEVRRERVWVTLPTTIDYYDGLKVVPSQPNRGRQRSKSLGRENSRVRLSTTVEYKDELVEKEKTKLRRAAEWECVFQERKRMWAFLREVQRTVDWKVSGLKLVDRDTDREVERAYDGGLWTVPVPPTEKEMLEKEFAKLRV